MNRRAFLTGALGAPVVAVAAVMQQSEAPVRGDCETSPDQPECWVGFMETDGNEYASGGDGNWTVQRLTYVQNDVLVRTAAENPPPDSWWDEHAPGFLEWRASR